MARINDVMRLPAAKAAVRLALDEDLGKPWCDATSTALVDPKAWAEGEIYAKGTGCVVSGTTVVTAVMKAVDPQIKVKILKRDGKTPSPSEVYYAPGTGVTLPAEEMLRFEIWFSTASLYRVANLEKIRLIPRRG